jgi:hypothetical protein
MGRADVVTELPDESVSNAPGSTGLSTFVFGALEMSAAAARVSCVVASGAPAA